MKIIVADIFQINNTKDFLFPKKFSNHKIVWDLRDALFRIWEGTVTEIAIPELGTPGYDFESFIEDMIKIKQIKDRPKICYYELEKVKKS